MRKFNYLVTLILCLVGVKALYALPERGKNGRFVKSKKTVKPSEESNKSDFDTLKQKSYIEEEVSYVNHARKGTKGAEVKLVGTLRLPKNASAQKPVPVVLFIGGTGPMSREILDNELKNDHPCLYLDLLNCLADTGIASLIVDKPGHGKSTGANNWTEMNFEDSASDAQAGVQYLRSRLEIDATKIGLIGHSEGGNIATMVANRANNVAFVLLLAPCPLDHMTLLCEQNGWIARARQSGKSEESIKRKIQFLRIISQLACYPLALYLRFFTIQDCMTDALGIEPKDRWKFLISRHQIFLKRYDPVKDLKKLRVPVAVWYMAGDGVVNPTKSAERMLEALQSSPSENYSVKVLKRFGLPFEEDSGFKKHMFMIKVSDLPKGQQTSWELLSQVTRWILERTK